MHDTAFLRPWLLLRAVRGLGDAGYCRLVQAFGSPQAVLEASPDALASRGDTTPAAASAIRRGPDAEAVQAVEAELQRIERSGAQVLTYCDAAYPSRLRTIADPPPLLYVTGTMTDGEEPSLAIVGSRRATASGCVLTEQLSRDLAALGFTIVSGLARGIDAAAHRGALAAQGRTIAVLGCGVDRTYPPEHRALRSEIERTGAVLAELPLGAAPHGHHFPRRNRIISGMSLGVIVTEATLESGSLITARLAAEQGREVFAVPGFAKADTSRGTNGLIKQGAKLIEGVPDILEELMPQLGPAFRARLVTPTEPAKPSARLDEKETRLYGLLKWDATHIDDLIAQSGLPAAEVSGLLLALELKGLLRQLPGHSYVRL